MTFVAVTICFRGHFQMTWDLLKQMTAQGGCNNIFAFNNGPPEVRYSWDGIDEITTVEAEDVNLNAMYNEGWDMALEAAGTERLAYGTFNNDLELLSPDFVQSLVEGLYSSPKLAAVSGTEMFYPGQTEVVPALPDYGLQGNTLMMRGDLPFRYDPAFHWWWSDVDLINTMVLAGWETGIVPGAQFIHLEGGSQTVKTHYEAIGYHEKTAQDTEYFYKKWPTIPRGEKNLPVP